MTKTFALAATLALPLLLIGCTGSVSDQTTDGMSLSSSSMSDEAYGEESSEIMAGSGAIDVPTGTGAVIEDESSDASMQDSSYNPLDDARD